jgi:uncharacterized protein
MKVRTALTIAAGTLAGAALITGTASAATTSAPATHVCHSRALTVAQEETIFEDYATARASADPKAMAKVITPNMMWVYPAGKSIVSGTARGLAQVIARAKAENDYGATFSLVNAFQTPQGIAVEVHAAGTHNGKTLNQDLIDNVQFKGDKVSSIISGATDFAALDDYFANAS